MQKSRILIAESRGFPPAALDRLSQAGLVELADLDRAGVERAIPEAEVLWVRLRHRIDAALLDRARLLRMIATPTTGPCRVSMALVLISAGNSEPSLRRQEISP